MQPKRIKSTFYPLVACEPFSNRMLYKCFRSMNQSGQMLVALILTTLLSSCFHPPFNNFKNDNRAPRRVAADTTIGGVVGAIATGTTSGTLIGGAIGGTIGLVTTMQRDSKKYIVRELGNESIQYVQYGDTNLLIIPTDKYYLFMSPRLNELCYPGLNNVVRLLKRYPYALFYIAGFTDDVGSKEHKRKLTQAQAETMMTFLWANGIPQTHMKAEGYRDMHPVAFNSLIHGSAENRRVEIEWFNKPNQPKQTMAQYIK